MLQNSLENGGKIRIQKAVPDYMQDDKGYLARVWQEMQWEFGRNLWQTIQKVRNPVVVAYREEIRTMGTSDVLTMEAELTPVHYQHITLPRMNEVDMAYYETRDLSFWQKIKVLFGKSKK